MPIFQGMTSSFKAELPQAVHDLLTDTIKIALYTSLADISPSTTVYTTVNEISGTGYVAGGEVLTGASVVLSGTTACISFANVSWSASTITARGALIYNASKSNKSIAVLDFGADKFSNNSAFSITFPAATPTAAVLRIT